MLIGWRIARESVAPLFVAFLLVLLVGRRYVAAPIVLDLALFSDFAHRAGMKGIQEWLSFYYKSPMAAAEYQLF